LAPGSPASETCFEDESGDDSGIEYCSRQTKSSHEKHLPERPDDGVRWREIIRQGLPELVEEAGLGIPKIAFAGSTPIFIWMTTTDIFIALSKRLESALWIIAYQHPHQYAYAMSEAVSLLSLPDAASLSLQLARESPGSLYVDVFLTLQAHVRQELLRLQQEHFWDNMRMSQVPDETQNYNHSFARYLFLVLLALIGSPARLTYDNKRIVVPQRAEDGQRCVHHASGEIYLVRHAHSSGAVTVMFQLYHTKEKVLARLTVDALHEIAKHGIEYDMERLKQWQGLEAWRLSASANDSDSS
jgi:hypothetical protein